ncbi:SDR family NAD(P)-dependent oxidoreductase [Kitasatospora herbaricolor]|uniref:SDR family NAD(P)-dependent oxidoreductase n=1 Tax=Kitasatospora herbaricolor TaxID=68217 RepID=UPI0036DD389D
MNASQHAGRVVVITGAGAGIGRACARAFAERGDRLALIARGGAGLEAAAAEARQAGTTAITVEADIADPEAVEAAAERIEDELGPIDVWVNGAVPSALAPFAEITPEEFRRVTEAGYLGYVYTTRIALRRMLPRGRGTLVHVGSAGAHRGAPPQSAYSGADGGAPPAPTAEPRRRAPTAAPSTPSRAGTRHSAATCWPPAPPCGRRWSGCPR